MFISRWTVWVESALTVLCVTNEAYTPVLKKGANTVLYRIYEPRHVISNNVVF